MKVMEKNIDYRFLFESVPGSYLVLSPDLTIEAVSDSYLEATFTKRAEILGKNLFFVFPDNPDDPGADGESNLRNSLEIVTRFKKAHRMDVQKYDIRRTDGTFEARYWSPINKPILDDNNELLYIIHSVEDVTDKLFIENRNKNTELLLKSSIESLTDTLIFSVDRNYRYLNFNTSHKKATVAVYGVEIELGMSLWDHVTNESDKKKIKANFDKAFSGEAHVTIEEYGDMDHFYFETRYNPIRNNEGEIIGVTAFAHNISERKKAEDQLIQTNKFLDTILENVPNMLFVKDAKDLRFLRLNNAGEKLLGFSRADLVGKNDYDFFPKEQADFFTGKDRDVLRNGNLLDIAEEKISTSSGDRWLRTKKIPVNDQNGDPLYLIGISEDITQKKYNEEKISSINRMLEKANVELERSNELLSKLFDLNPGAISMSRMSDLTLYNVNEAFLNLFGFDSKEEVIGRTAEELNLLPDVSLRTRIMDTIRRDGKVHNIEGQIKTRAGEFKWISASVHVVEISNDPYLLTVTLDITKRKDQEDLVALQSQKLKEINEELGSSNELFSNLFNLNPASIVISRVSDGTIVDANQSFIDMFEFGSKAEVIDRNAAQLEILTNPSKREYLISELKKNKKIVSIEDRYQTKNKRIRWAANSVQIIEIAGTECFLSVMLDITQRKHQEKLLEKQKEELSMINQELESFSYSVSHDLKAPLRSLQGFSRALMENYAGKFDDDADRWLRFIEANAKRMDSLIQDILSFSKVSRSDLRITEVNMEELIEDIYNAEVASYPAKNINFHFENIPAHSADPAMIRQVWHNLISNALKYSSQKEKMEISIGSEKDGAFQVYSIKDNGVGFDDKYADKLFGVFQRLHSNDEFEGTGVGLAIVKRIIQKHGGWITASSVLGEGSEFKFGLPI